MHAVSLGYLEPSKSQEEKSAAEWRTEPLPEAFHPIRIYMREGTWHNRHLTRGPRIGDILVSTELRALWEEFAPEDVHFDPVEFTLLDGEVVKDRYWMPKILLSLDALIPERSAVVESKSVLTGKPMGLFSYLRHVAPTLRRDKVEGHHVWTLSRMLDGCMFVSDKVKAQMDARDLGPFDASAAPLE